MAAIASNIRWGIISSAGVFLVVLAAWAPAAQAAPVTVTGDETRLEVNVANFVKILSDGIFITAIPPARLEFGAEPAASSVLHRHHRGHARTRHGDRRRPFGLGARQSKAPRRWGRWRCRDRGRQHAVRDPGRVRSVGAIGPRSIIDADGASNEQQSNSPVLLAVDDDLDALRRISDQLRLRYAADYNVLCEKSPARAREKLKQLREDGGQVALVLASQSLAEDTGADLLAYVKHVHPRAKRGLLIEFGDWGVEQTAEAVLNAMALGHIDYYVLKPWRSPDEFFHRTITEFLHEWRRNVGYGSAEVEVVGEQWSPKVHELTSLLIRNGFPHVFHPRDSEEGRRILRECGCEEDNVPVVRLLRKTILRDPSREELARAYGVTTQLSGDCDFDVIVVGAGPAGLASAVAASSEGLGRS